VNVVFVNHNSFASNSAVHVFHLANELVQLGVDCAVAVPKDVHTVRDLGTPRFRARTYEELLRSPAGERGPTLVHAWTPREIVRCYTEKLAARLGCGYVVHLEDNEESILERMLGPSAVAEIRRRPEADIPESLSHPVRYRRFLAGATGVTALIDRLLEFKPAGVPGQIFWPAFDADLDWGMARDERLREQLGIATSERVVVYTGNVHPANQQEVSSLYLALALLRRRGIRVRLVRTGIDFVPPHEPALSDAMREIVIQLGVRPRSELPAILSLADVLVQPGGSDPFNDYRFPSKLPEFFASGKPVLLPRSNIGRRLVDGEQCLLLEAGNALEIARKLEPLMDDGERRRRIGAAGRAFALEHLSWPKAAHDLNAFYQSLVRQPHPMGGAKPSRTKKMRNHKTTAWFDDAALDRIAQRYRSFEIGPLSYATVRDYCDSFDHLRPLATANQDLKDAQRPWVLKAILSQVPPGGHLLEIGGGEPFVADILERLGYEVTIVDPYDGSGNGPQEYETFRRQCPDVRFVRDQFSESTDGLEPRSFDCIYSISVLEHIPDEALPGVYAGLARFLKPEGLTVNAIDHVHKGAGAEPHYRKLVRMISGFGLLQQDLDRMLGTMSLDLETYYLSAEAHNRWRGTVPYEQFPMRICVSIQTCPRADALVPR